MSYPVASAPCSLDALDELPPALPHPPRSKRLLTSSPHMRAPLLSASSIKKWKPKASIGLFNRGGRHKTLLVLLFLIAATFWLLWLGDTHTHPLPLEPPVVYHPQADSPSVLKRLAPVASGLSKREICLLYFQTRYQANPTWRLETYDQYDPRATDHSRFMREEREALQRERFKKEHGLTDFQLMNTPYNVRPEPWREVALTAADEAAIERRFQTQLDLMHINEGGIVDGTADLRTFGACHLQPNAFDALADAARVMALAAKANRKAKAQTDIQGLNTTCAALQSRILPWMTGQFPVFTRWDGTTVRERFPIMSEYVDGNSQQVKSTVSESSSSCFVRRLLESFNGRGIVITAADRFEDDLVSLLRVLRSVDNTLPVAIFHSGDLSATTQARVVEAARGLMQLPDSYAAVPEARFPVQEVWFADVSGCISKPYKRFFVKFYNKLLPHVFGPFEETVLIDVDAVPMVAPDTFFASKAYAETETLFFKDRALPHSSSLHARLFFQKLFPSALDGMVGIPAASALTLQNPYMSELTKRRHLMESGIVVYRKSVHWTGILMTAQVNFWASVRKQFGGDKELFWLGMSLAGDERYAFNGNHVAAVGRATPLQYTAFQATEVCGIQPAHVSSDDDHTLLWINSGFRYCKRDDTFEAARKQSITFAIFAGLKEHPELREDISALRERYRSAITIETAIIPPECIEPVKGMDASAPASGWVCECSCGSYMYCAYDRVGDGLRPEHRGKVVTFSPAERQWFTFVGDLWMQSQR